MAAWLSGFCCFSLFLETTETTEKWQDMALWYDQKQELMRFCIVAVSFPIINVSFMTTKS